MSKPPHGLFDLTQVRCPDVDVSHHTHRLEQADQAKDSRDAPTQLKCRVLVHGKPRPDPSRSDQCVRLQPSKVLFIVFDLSPKARMLTEVELECTLVERFRLRPFLGIPQHDRSLRIM
ncbi:MAG TPA: hypothetical protein VGB15_18395 [Longimicrobium sp.]